jgi:hypothetical protein
LKFLEPCCASIGKRIGGRMRGMMYSFPYCPHRGCYYHRENLPEPYTSFGSWGSYPTDTFGEVPRFRCKACGHTFSTQTFSIDYFAKRKVDYRDLVSRLAETSSLSAIGRAITASTDSVSNRVSRAARQALAAQARLARTRRPSEDLAADGFESFCVSQYFPNNIQLLVGAESQYVYAADHATIRRKGRMTKKQKVRRATLELRFKADPKAVEGSFSRIAAASLHLLSESARPSIELWTDRHRAYPRGIAASPCAKALLGLGRLRHLQVSSRAARTRDNPLFPVNYLDRELRKDLHEHVRESVCFGRNVNRQMERLALYLFHHNFLKLHRARWTGFSHAIVAGYDAASIEGELEGLWTARARLSLIDLPANDEETWRRSRRTPLGAARDYLPGYAVA